MKVVIDEFLIASSITSWTSLIFRPYRASSPRTGSSRDCWRDSVVRRRRIRSAQRGVHRKGLISLPHDKPTAVIVIDSEAKLRGVLPTIRPMITEGIVTLTDTEVIPLR
jgi:Uncharacterized ACR, COG1993